MLTIYTKPVGRLTPIEYEHAHALNMGPIGFMQERLEDCYREPSMYPARATFAYDGGVLVGWALKFRTRSDELHMYIYVRKDRRGEGVGRKITAHARKGVRQPLKVYGTATSRPMYETFAAAGKVEFVPGSWHSS